MQKLSLMDHMEDINYFPITVLPNKKIAYDYPIIFRLLNSVYKTDFDAILYAISALYAMPQTYSW